jgi:epoxyqueuosine reductase
VSDDLLSFESLATFIRQLVAGSPLNRLARIDDSPIFDAPILGVADGDDPLFVEYQRTIIGPHHLMPRDILASATPDRAPRIPSAVRVLCWVLPISAETRRSNAVMTREPSRRWAHTRYYGELFNNVIRVEVERYIRTHGSIAVAAVASPLFKTLRDIPGGPSSTWSERHALYAAGLGTFGLCDGFLTQVGKAMRCGSVVVDLPLVVTKRHHPSHHSACPYLARGACGDCMARCPAGAIGPHGHDKNACAHYQDETLLPLRESYGVPTTGCGLCQTSIPCESSFPS